MLIAKYPLTVSCTVQFDNAQPLNYVDKNGLQLHPSNPDQIEDKASRIACLIADVRASCDMRANSEQQLQCALGDERHLVVEFLCSLGMQIFSQAALTA